MTVGKTTEAIAPIGEMNSEGTEKGGSFVDFLLPIDKEFLSKITESIPWFSKPAPSAREGNTGLVAEFEEDRAMMGQAAQEVGDAGLDGSQPN